MFYFCSTQETTESPLVSEKMKSLAVCQGKLLLKRFAAFHFFGAGDSLSVSLKGN